MSDGAALIAAERQRQVEVEGYEASHDRSHGNGQLARAAAVYAAPDPIYVKREGQRRSIAFVDPWPQSPNRDPSERGPAYIPWRKPECDRVTELVRAGALIAAEIDRLLPASVSEDHPASQGEEREPATGLGFGEGAAVLNPEQTARREAAARPDFDSTQKRGLNDG